MGRFAVFFLAAALGSGCVSGTDPANGAIRLLHAVPDAPRMNLSLDGELRLAALDFPGGSGYVADRAAGYQVKIDELLTSSATSETRTIYDQPVTLGVNEEVTLVVVGEAASASEQIIEIRNPARAVAFGQTRLQFVHAAVGAGAVDVYVTEPDEIVTAVAPLAPGLGFRSFTAQQDVAGGGARIVLTEPGDPTAVLFDSGAIFLTLEGTLLVAIVRNPEPVTGGSAFLLSILTGTGSGTAPDTGTPANVRVVNAAPASYSLDAFVNVTSVDDAIRQVCDPLSAETDTLLEICAAPFGSISAFSEVAAGSYDLKVQKTAADAVAAQTLSGSLGAGVRTTLVLTGLTADNATATTQGLLTLLGTRRLATTAQLRIADASLAADATVSGDPTTDRLELYITEPGAALTDESPDFSNLALGSDTGYVPLAAGAWQVTLARADTATPDAAPELLFTQEVALADGGVYTLVITDSTGGVTPLQSLSLEDDPAP
jgi:hypothetical protein